PAPRLAGLERRRVELDLAAHGADRNGTWEVADVGLGVEQSEDAVGRAERLLDPRPLAGETADGPRHHPQVEKERDELSLRELAGGDLMAAVPEHHDRRRETKEADGREHDRADARTVDALLEHHEKLLVEALGLVVLARERLDHAHLGEGLLQHADCLALRILRRARDVADLATEVLA